eukprot:TRINITY_DN3039_c0_g1_i1.p1 TRINITY_DN3039_c0_g1~~TRINITY_DN3039_c0_g1_i1.p1  ORF type:complete len:944 (+),score=243.36 TRINITY_DN3039_c0_g1_i1:211-2832(+)
MAAAGAEDASPSPAVAASLPWIRYVVTGLVLLATALFWQLAGKSLLLRSDSGLEFSERRRRRLAAEIADVLGRSPSRRPARRLWRAIFDEFEEVLVTSPPVCLSPEAARLQEMAAALRESLTRELQEATKRHDLAELQELLDLGRQAQRFLCGGDLCEAELQKAEAFLGSRCGSRTETMRRLLKFVDGQVAMWLGCGLLIKVVSQMPGPARMIYVSAAVTAASRGAEGLPDFYAAVRTALWLFAAEKLLQLTGRFTMFRGEQLFTVRLKKEVYTACLRQDMEFYDSHKCGELQNRLNVDTSEFCQKALYFPVRFIQFACFIVFNLVTLFIMNPRLVSATLAVLPFTMFGNLVVAKRVQRFYLRIKKRADHSASVTHEVLSNIRTVRSFAREDHELWRYGCDQEYEQRVSGLVNVLQSITAPFFDILSEVSFFVGLYYGGLLVSKGMLAPGEVITLVQGTQACNGPLNDLFDTLPQISRAVQPAARISDLLAREPRIEQRCGSGRVPDEAQLRRSDAAVGGAVSFQDVHFAYPARRDVQVLRGLTFTAEPGEVVALVGATGCGKSTVMWLLMRFYQPASGEVRFDGQSLEAHNVYWLRRQIGLVQQEPLLFAGSIRDNLLYGVPTEAVAAGEHHDFEEELREACQLACAWDFVRALPEGLSTEVGERGVQLSGGQKQRLAIARAMLKRPKVLLLDEATSALDVESEKVVQRAMDEVIRRSACTTLVIAHRLATVQSAAKVVVVESGVVAEEGPPAELALRPDGAFARLLRVQGESLRGGEAEAAAPPAPATAPAEAASGGASEGDGEAGDERERLARRVEEQVAFLESTLRKKGLLPGGNGDCVAVLNGSSSHVVGALADLRKVAQDLRSGDRE